MHRKKLRSMGSSRCDRPCLAPCVDSGLKKCPKRGAKARCWLAYLCVSFASCLKTHACATALGHWFALLMCARVHIRSTTDYIA